jgi:hypothetical protein
MVFDNRTIWPWNRIARIKKHLMEESSFLLALGKVEENRCDQHPDYNPGVNI